MLHLKTKHTGNSTYKKLAAQWLNEAWFFVSSSLLADSLVLRNRQLLVAAKRYTQLLDKNLASGLGDREVLKFNLRFNFTEDKKTTNKL